MTAFLLLCLPVIAMVAIGWMAIRVRLMPVAAIDILSGFSFRFALPALVLRMIGQGDGATLFDPLFFAAYLASGGLTFLLAFLLIGRPGWSGAGRAGARATTATVSNLGFLGPPIVLSAFGPRGAGPLAMAILSEVMIVMSVGAVIMAASGKDSARRKRAPWGLALPVLRAVAANPVIGAIALGAVMAVADWTLPPALDRVLSLLGASAAPTALFSVGGALAVRRPDRSTLRVAAGISLFKLGLYPLVVWWLLTVVLKAGSFWCGAGTLMAALPSAGSTIALAGLYTDDAERVSAGIVLSTLLSVITVPLVGYWVLRP